MFPQYTLKRGYFQEFNVTEPNSTIILGPGLG